MKFLGPLDAAAAARPGRRPGGRSQQRLLWHSIFSSHCLCHCFLSVPIQLGRLPQSRHHPSRAALPYAAGAVPRASSCGAAHAPSHQRLFSALHTIVYMLFPGPMQVNTTPRTAEAKKGCARPLSPPARTHACTPRTPASHAQYLRLVAKADGHPVGVRRAPLQLVDLRPRHIREDGVQQRLPPRPLPQPAPHCCEVPDKGLRRWARERGYLWLFSLGAAARASWEVPGSARRI